MLQSSAYEQASRFVAAKYRSHWEIALNTACCSGFTNLTASPTGTHLSRFLGPVWIVGPLVPDNE